MAHCATIAETAKLIDAIWLRAESVQRGHDAWLGHKVRTPGWTDWGAGVLARMILASFWMKIPVAYRRRYGGEGLGLVRLQTAT